MRKCQSCSLAQCSVAYCIEWRGKLNERVTVRIDMQCDLIDMDNLDDIHILELKEAFDEFDKV